ncbi:Para-hydroxybenzoate--polyprenyltransferase, mitochondrial precursor (PHB:polyprenyltransferase) [Coemansia sp. IMI 203386]|nr:Para-hydroxybenzoate--polyprenyltransferase, mitochondrial precursor (PHB:polyprenyltransferase) [Coemansia sp. IMI 203386]
MVSTALLAIAKAGWSPILRARSGSALKPYLFQSFASTASARAAAKSKTRNTEVSLFAPAVTGLCRYVQHPLALARARDARGFASTPGGQRSADADLNNAEGTPAQMNYGPVIGRFPASARPYLYLTRLDKPIGTWLLYWPCVWGIGMAAFSTGMPMGSMASMMALFGTGAVVMRGAGCTINDLWDVRFDRMVERTKTRPIASGAITRPRAFAFLGAQLAAGLAVLVQLNPYTIAFCLGSMPLVVLYPFMKRITYWPQLVLGLAYNWGALAGWSAVAGSIDWAVALPLYAAGVSWTLVYDTIYGHQDKRDDIIAGVKSTSLLFADKTKAILSGFSTSTIGLICLSGYMNGQGLPFYATVLGAGTAHLVWQLRKVDIDNPAVCWSVFKSNTWFGAIIFAAILADLAYVRYSTSSSDAESKQPAA